MGFIKDNLRQLLQIFIIIIKHFSLSILESILESALIIRIKKGKGKTPFCLTIKPQKTAFWAKPRAIIYLIDGSLAFVDDDKCQIRRPFEEDLFQQDLDREIQLNLNVSEQNLFRLNVGIQPSSLHIPDLPDDLKSTHFLHQTCGPAIYSVCPPFKPVQKLWSVAQQPST